MTKGSPITDSPWFWMLVYSTVPLIGLALLSQKYAQRQSRLERQYQGHVAAAEKKSQQFATGGKEPMPAAPGEAEKPAPAPSKYSSPEETIIPLTPLLVIFLAIACFAAVMLRRDWTRQHRESRDPIGDPTTTR